MDDDELNQLDEQYARKYQPLITFTQAAEIAQRAVATIYDWSTRNLLDECKVGRGRGARLNRKKFLRVLGSIGE